MGQKKNDLDGYVLEARCAVPSCRHLKAVHSKADGKCLGSNDDGRVMGCKCPGYEKAEIK
jgi:hypothetical protein